MDESDQNSPILNLRYEKEDTQNHSDFDTFRALTANAFGAAEKFYGNIFFKFSILT